MREVLLLVSSVESRTRGERRAQRADAKNGELGKKLKVSAQNRRKKLKAAPAPARLKMLKVTDPPETQP